MSLPTDDCKSTGKVDINDDENALSSTKRDLKESFTIGALGNDSKMHGENNWPKSCPVEIREKIEMYWDIMIKVSIEIARALATDPKFVLLDEPFAGVDPIAVEDIQSIVSDLKKKNIGILITDHNVQETLSITDRTYLLFEGSILKSGTAEDLASDEQVRRVYLGRNFELKKKVI